MFLVSDTIDFRQKLIRNYLPNEPVVAIFLAAADFEWTIRRCILALGRSPTKHIRQEVLTNCHGLKSYKEKWKQEVTPRTGKRLPEVVPNWQIFSTKAYPLRNRSIHGVQGTTGKEYAKYRAEIILAASKAINEFALEHNEPNYGRKIIRRRAR